MGRKPAERWRKGRGLFALNPRPRAADVILVWVQWNGKLFYAGQAKPFSSYLCWVGQWITTRVTSIAIYLDFLSTKRALWLVDSWSRATDQIQMYPDRDTMRSCCPHAWYNSTWLFKRKSKCMTKLLMYGPTGNWLVLFPSGLFFKFIISTGVSENNVADSITRVFN